MNEILQVADLVFEVRRSPRRKTVGLTVDRGGELLIHAPVDAAREDLEHWTRGKLLWVYRKLTLKEEMALSGREPEFVSGESFSYLGRNYQLKITDEQKEPFRFDGRRFYLRRDARSTATEHFRRWYAVTGSTWIDNRVKLLASRTGMTPNRIDVRDLGYRWGSCGKNKVLFFNWKMLQLPVRLVDYIIVHELVHLHEPHHGAAFWQAVERALPDWKERKEDLRTKAKDMLWVGAMIDQ
jgi:predicted metal-dependent hydrolase